MLVKIFKNKGGGSPKASIDYLRGKHQDREGARVLRGDPDLSQSIAESLEFKNKYTVGCLSFEERDLEPEQKAEIMDRFEKAIFSGMEADQYNISWIEHTDKGRLELNFFIPNVELTTQKRLQPYYDKADRPLVDTFKKVINHEYGLTSPDAPEKRQMMKINLDTPKSVKELKEGIHALISERVSEGEITSQSQIVELFGQAGIEVARVTEKSISIKNPEGGRNVRFKGELYEREFYEKIGNIEEFRKHFGAEQGAGASQDREDHEGAYRRDVAKLAEESARRAERHKKLYPQQNAVDVHNHEHINDFSPSMGMDNIPSERGAENAERVEASPNPIRTISAVYKAQSGEHLRRKRGALYRHHEQESGNLQNEGFQRRDEAKIKGGFSELSRRTKAFIQKYAERIGALREGFKGLKEYVLNATERKQAIDGQKRGIDEHVAKVNECFGDFTAEHERLKTVEPEAKRTDRAIARIERKVERGQDKGWSLGR